MTDLAEQLSEIAVGLKHRLDTTELVTATASAGAGYEVGSAMAGVNNVMAQRYLLAMTNEARHPEERKRRRGPVYKTRREATKCLK